MPVKLGKGGKGNQNYDETNGEFTSDNGGTGAKTGDKYSADSGISDDEILAWINDPENSDISSTYQGLPDDKKPEFISAIKEYMDQQETDMKMHERFPSIDMGTFLQWGRTSEGNANPVDLAFFRQDYKGAGQRSFNFTKALRIGYDKTAYWYDNEYDPTMGGLRPGYEKRRAYDLMDRRTFENGVESMENLTHGFKAPQDFSGYRLVDMNYIASMFRGVDEFRDMSFKKDMFNYNNFESEPDVDDIYSRLKKMVGKVVSGDGSFTSFSCVEGKTHMGKIRGKSDFKRIHIIYDIPKGKDLFVSTYAGESEAVLPRETDFYVKDVQKETGQYYDDSGKLVPAERIVLLYGIR